MHGLAFDARDVLYAGSVVGHSIYRVDTLIVAETTRGKLSRIAGEQRSEIVSDLAAPLGLALAGNDAVYVSEMAAGQVSRIDVNSGARQVIAQGLDRPQGIAT